jgi:hypothetical protein
MHPFTVIPLQEGTQGQGVAQDTGSIVTLTLHAQRYTGFYEYIETPSPIFNVLGGAPETSRPQTTTVGELDRETAYVPGTGKGRLLATAPNGEAIRCEFATLRRHGRGLCHDSGGMVYDLHVQRPEVAWPWARWRREAHHQ